MADSYINKIHRVIKKYSQNKNKNYQLFWDQHKTYANVSRASTTVKYFILCNSRSTTSTWKKICINIIFSYTNEWMRRKMTNSNRLQKTESHHSFQSSIANKNKLSMSFLNQFNESLNISRLFNMKVLALLESPNLRRCCYCIFRALYSVHTREILLFWTNTSIRIATVYLQFTKKMLP